MRTGNACPVCSLQGLPPDIEKCPQCDADLTCFQALDTLAEHNSADRADNAEAAEQKSSSDNRAAVFLLLLLLVLLSLLFLFFFFRTSNRVLMLDQQVTALKAEMQTAKQADRKQNPEQNKAAAICALPVQQPKAKEKEEWEKDPDAEHKEQNQETKEEAQADGVAAVTSSGDRLRKGRAGNVQQREQSSRINVITIVNVAEPAAKVTIAKSTVEEPATLQAQKVVKTAEPDLSDLPESKAGSGASGKPTAALPVLQPPPARRWPDSTFLYQTGQGDTVWGIAEHFYGDGRYYPVIMEQNPDLVISRVSKEQILRLLSDRSALRNFYARRIERRDGLLVWKHEILAGETRQSIQARFAPPGSSGRVFYAQNPAIVPGRIVRIILQ
ncbi:MAG: LysM peptidoglycan-binding domain-containing protein [Candidatus Electrothrix sp. YB6]